MPRTPAETGSISHTTSATLAIALALLLPHRAPAAANPHDTDPPIDRATGTALTGPEHAATVRAQALIEALRDECGFPGLSAAAGFDGQVLWSAGAGFADAELLAPVRGDTVYRLASISKAITGVAVARLVEDGRLDLDRPVVELLPDGPPHWAGITTRMLMAHTSGIRSYTPEERDDLAPRQRDTVGEALAMFRDDPLVHPPGERFTYTTLGYIVVRAIVERITGEPFMGFVGRTVLRPAGMLDTGPDDNARIVPGRAAFFHAGPDGVGTINAPSINTSYKPAGGGMIGSAADLGRLMIALQDHRLIAPETRELMWRPTVDTRGVRHDYGLGWGLAEDTRGRFYAVQIGGQIGTGSAVMLRPDTGVFASVIANRAAGPVGRAEVVAIAELFEMARAGVAPHIPAALPSGAWEATVEHGGVTWRGVLAISVRDGRVLGALTVANPADASDHRRFRIATATPGSAPGTVRLYTVHHRWGVFPFEITPGADGGVRGRLDRVGDGAWTLSAVPIGRTPPSNAGRAP